MRGCVILAFELPHNRRPGGPALPIRAFQTATDVDRILSLLSRGLGAAFFSITYRFDKRIVRRTQPQTAGGLLPID